MLVAERLVPVHTFKPEVASLNITLITTSNTSAGIGSFSNITTQPPKISVNCITTMRP